MAETMLSSTPTPETELPSEPARKGFLSRLGRFILQQREASILVVAIVEVIYFQFASSNFITAENIRTIFQFVAATAIIAAGEVMLLICGEIDLSVGNVYALAPFIMYFAVENYGLSLPLGVVAGLIVSLLVGMLNGIVVVYLQVPSLIA